MSATTKQRQRGGEGSVNSERNVAATKSKPAGDRNSETDRSFASSKTKPSDSHREAEGSQAGQAAGGEYAASEDHMRAACRDLQVLQQYRSEAINSRIRIDNAIQATIARYYGYSAKLEESERKAKWSAAGILLLAVRKGDQLEGRNAEIYRRAGGLILNSFVASDGFQRFIDEHSKAMESLVAALPIAGWVKSIRGLGLVSVGCIIGESGDLSNYANPAKLWKRLGLAPFNGKMPSSWRSQGGLTKEEWIEVGYNPRRRSVLYVVSECLVKQNDGRYRAVYDASKAAKLALNDEKWPKLRCHRHGMLLAVKELVLDLWLQWHGKAKREPAK